MDDHERTANDETIPQAAARRLRSILESLLLAAPEPLALTRLAQILPAYPRREIQRALEALAEEYRAEERGLRLQEVAGGWQLRTAPANAEYVRSLLAERPVRLSRAALETLAVIAYRQPVTRAEIEAIRGVDVDAVLNGLLERRLVRVIGRKDAVGRPLLYGTTQEFLETFGLKDLSALPTLEELGEAPDAFDRATARLAERMAEPEDREAPREAGEAGAASSEGEVRGGSDSSGDSGRDGSGDRG
jgi:segregation and condensation protein B